MIGSQQTVGMLGFDFFISWIPFPVDELVVLAMAIEVGRGYQQ